MREVVETSTCDFCGEPAGKSYTVSVPGQFSIVDLCETHGEPFEAALAKGTQEPRKRQGDAAPKRQTSHDFLPIDEE